MSQAQPQNYGNHGRMVTPFHYVALPLLLINFGWSIYRAITAMSTETIIGALTAVALIIIGLFSRIHALWAQDRVIRLEMRLKLTDILPDDLKSRIDDLSTAHLVALRFASDAELPGLVRRVLDGSLTDQKAIKQAIVNRQADYQRV